MSVLLNHFFAPLEPSGRGGSPTRWSLPDRIGRGPVTDGATLTLPGGALIATLSSSDNNLHSISFAPVESLVVQGPGGIVTSVHKSFSQVPGPVVGAGLPGLVAACGGLLALARRRRRQHIA